MPPNSTVDARGKVCPIPVLMLRKRTQEFPPGWSLILLADDPLAAVDVPHYCRMEGLACARLDDQLGSMVFQIDDVPRIRR